MQRIVIFGRDGIELVIVAARTSDSQAQESFRHHVDPISFAEVADASVGIENILRADAFQKSFARRRVGPNLYAIAQGHQHKPGPVIPHFVAHRFQQ